MAILESCPKHNMVSYLEKTDGNAKFHEIIDFLTRSSIHNALIVSLVIYTMFVEQFWTSAKSQTINNVRYINAKVAGKPVTIFEASIRSDLHFDNVDGIDSLNNHAIFDAIKLMGLKNVPVLLDHFPIHALSNKVFSFMVKKGKHFLGKVTPLFPNMLVQPTEDEGEGSAYPSPGPSPTISIPDPIPEGSGGNLGSHSSSCRNQIFEGNVKKLKKQARPFILHHKAWLRTVKRKNQNKKKVLKTSKRRSVFRQGRKTVKSSKGAPTVPTNTEWDDLDMDIDDTMDYTLAQDEGKTDKVDEKGESTDRQDEGTDMPKVSTARTKLSTDKLEEGTAEPEPRESTSSAAQTTPTPTPTTFGDDEMIAQVLLNMSQAKAVSKEKEKGEAKEERKRLTKEESTKTALSNEYDFIQARIEADRLLAERVQEAEREQFTVKEREKFLHDTIATQRWILDNKEDEAIRNKPHIKESGVSDLTRRRRCQGRCKGLFKDLLKQDVAEQASRREKIGRLSLETDLLQRMLDLGLEVERESTAALDLIRFIKQQIGEE
ncbi:hypothetical protein Tco_0831301 [Tanacetum coccineum]